MSTRTTNRPVLPLRPVVHAAVAVAVSYSVDELHAWLRDEHQALLAPAAGDASCDDERRRVVDTRGRLDDLLRAVECASFDAEAAELDGNELEWLHTCVAALIRGLDGAIDQPRAA